MCVYVCVCMSVISFFFFFDKCVFNKYHFLFLVCLFFFPSLLVLSTHSHACTHVHIAENRPDIIGGKNQRDLLQ